MPQKDSDILRLFIKDMMTLDDASMVEKWAKTPGLFEICKKNIPTFALFNILVKDFPRKVWFRLPSGDKISVFPDNDLI